MTELGDRLREARKEKGYTLDDLQEITKIQKRYLAGIENEEYSSMPGSFYVRAFIKQYAEAVGLDADEMLSLYKGSASKVETEEEERQLTTPTLTRRSSRSTGQLSQIMPKIIVALFIVVIIVVMWFLWELGPSKSPEVEFGNKPKPVQVEDQAKPDGEKQDPVVDEDEADEGKEDENADTEDEGTESGEQQTLENVSVSGENVTYSLSNTDKLELEIRTSEDSWIGVLDEKQVERTTGARVMTAGETVELDVSDAESIRIRVGRTNSTEIYVNGELLEYVNDRTTQNIYIEYKKD